MTSKDILISKITSRKLWVSLAAWITSLLTAFNVGESDIAKVCLIISGIGSLVVYVLSESKIDICNMQNNTDMMTGESTQTKT